MVVFLTAGHRECSVAFLFFATAPTERLPGRGAPSDKKKKEKKEKKKKRGVRGPGIEPGSTAWKATMLTITPATLSEQTGVDCEYRKDPRWSEEAGGAGQRLQIGYT